MKSEDCSWFFLNSAIHNHQSAFETCVFPATPSPISHLAYRMASSKGLRFAANVCLYRIAIPQSHRWGSMPVISFLNQKGWVGKTTLAIHIADAFTRRKQKVLLVDDDQQASALDWAAARQGEPRFPVIGLPKASIHKELPVIAKGFDWVILDGPPRVYDVVAAGRRTTHAQARFPRTLAALIRDPSPTCRAARLQGTFGPEALGPGPRHLHLAHPPALLHPRGERCPPELGKPS